MSTEAVKEAGMARGEAQRPESSNGSGSGVVLGPRDTLEGKLNIEGDVKLQGRVAGEVKASGDIQVDAGANVDASLDGRNVSVRGQVNGSVNARKKLVLAGSGRLNGDVRVSRLTVEDGATLNGNVSMANSSSPAEAPAEAHAG
jgi:cytoskeletal protein CcmA (bactofilin family)